MKPKFRTVASFVLALTLLAGCSGAKTSGPSTGDQASKTGDKTLVVGIEFEHAGNDPAIVYDLFS